MSSDPDFIHSDPAVELSLIGFGFTVFQFFHLLNDKVLTTTAPHAPRRFSLALILLGVVLLTLGIFNHLRETRGRRARRQALCEKGLIRHPEIVKTSSALLVAFLLWGVGIVAVVDVATHARTTSQAAR